LLANGIPWPPKQGKFAGEQGTPRRITANERRVFLKLDCALVAAPTFQRHGISRLPEIEYQVSERLTLGVVFKSPAM